MILMDELHVPHPEIHLYWILLAGLYQPFTTSGWFTFWGLTTLKLWKSAFRKRRIFGTLLATWRWISTRTHSGLSEIEAMPCYTQMNYTKLWSFVGNGWEKPVDSDPLWGWLRWRGRVFNCDHRQFCTLGHTLRWSDCVARQLEGAVEICWNLWRHGWEWSWMFF